MKPKIIARHLPQFHETRENNKRRGKGFTEWSIVKKAKPLFKGHKQPRIPLKNNYYNFLDIKTRKREGELAKQYGIYGFCYYHYRLNGKLLLEKGVEKMLIDNQPDINFCFSRGNGSRVRTWGKKIVDEVLMKQDYGGEGDIHDHIKYLMKYFKHKNYILIDNKPLFVIHNPKDIPNLDKMIKYRNKYCISKGFNGIYIIETLAEYNQSKKSPLSDALLQFEPGYSFGNINSHLNFLLKLIPYRTKALLFKYIQIIKNKIFLSKKIHRISYKKIMEKIIGFGSKKHNIKTYLSICVGRDNTPRKHERGIVFTGQSPVLFEKYLKQQYINSIKNKNEFMFINARNEWSEGAYLEPDELSGYKYLSAVKNIIKKYNK